MEDPEHESFDEFAAMMLHLLQSFDEVMKSSDTQAKLSAIELLGEVKRTMGDSLQHLLEKHDIRNEDLEKFIDQDESEMTKKVHSINKKISQINQKITPEVEKTLKEAGIQPKKRKLKLKSKMMKRLRTKD